MRLAFSTITVLRHPYGHPDILSYEDRIGPVFAEAERSPGFIDRARPVDPDDDATNFEWDWGVWGPFATPRFYTGGRVAATDSRASTLSIWTDLASVRAFARNGLHQYMLRNQGRWVEPKGWKGVAAWWIGDDEIPTWVEAARRIEHINDHGPSPVAFDFHTSYDQDGNPVDVPRVGAGPAEIAR
ncbi:MAG TPA: DUF3291 domain-containing protein [Jatrophihabitans sp.]|nr:DUF3291 domain-containing protein [Jatrophihabitans sp.]